MAERLLTAFAWKQAIYAEHKRQSQRPSQTYALVLTLIMLTLADGWLNSSMAAEPMIANGVNIQEYPSTAALLHGSDGASDPGKFKQICSATLIGCQTVLTAAHCVDDSAVNQSADELFVYLQHAGILPVASVAVHPEYNSPFADIAVLKLGEPVTGIEPSAVNDIDPTDLIPHAGTIVGFGITHPSEANSGIKRSGAVQTADCETFFDSESIDFEAPSAVPTVNTVYAQKGVIFSVEPGQFGDEYVGIVANNRTSACVDPADGDQKLGTGRGQSGSAGVSGFAINAYFLSPLFAGTEIRVEYQTLAGIPARLRLFNSEGQEVASETVIANPPQGICGFPGDPRARVSVSAVAPEPVTRAVMDLAEDTGGYVFVIDDFTATFQSLDNIEHVCWQYEDPLGLPGEESSTCNGDSGGPLFMNLGAGPVVAGVTSGGNSCAPPAFAFDTNVFAYRDFVLEQLGGDSTNACGQIPAVGSEAVNSVTQDGLLTDTNTSESLQFSVPPGVEELRVTLNGQQNASVDIDLYVRHGTGASDLNFDCGKDDESAFADCTFAAPDSGTWSVFVDAAEGSGEYQLTATQFMAQPDLAVSSCQDNCGGSAGTCWCDDSCTQYGDCCSDYVPMCGGAEQPSPLSCQGACGGFTGSCWCDDACSSYGDCCSDYQPVCASPASASLALP